MARADGIMVTRRVVRELRESKVTPGTSRRVVACGQRHQPTQVLQGAGESRSPMPTVMIIHEVDDVDHWLASPKRAEVFGPMGITIRTFIDPERSNRVGPIAEIPDLAVYEEVMASDAAAEAMKSDGVRPETLLVLLEG